MTLDPMVEELRAVGQKYVESFKGNWKALVNDLRRRAKEEGRELISLPPKKPAIRRARKPAMQRSKHNAA
jgi:hypothetical protein